MRATGFKRQAIRIQEINTSEKEQGHFYISLKNKVNSKENIAKYIISKLQNIKDNILKIARDRQDISYKGTTKQFRWQSCEIGNLNPGAAFF